MCLLHIWFFLARDPSFLLFTSSACCFLPSCFLLSISPSSLFRDCTSTVVLASSSSVCVSSYPSEASAGLTCPVVQHGHGLIQRALQALFEVLYCHDIFHRLDVPLNLRASCPGRKQQPSLRGDFSVSRSMLGTTTRATHQSLEPTQTVVHTVWRTLQILLRCLHGAKQLVPL